MSDGVEQMPRARGGIHYGWIVVGTLFFVAVAASGGRGMLSIFIKPIEDELGWARTTLSVAA